MSEFAVVQRNKTNGQKFINIRKNSLIQEDDWVEIRIANKERGIKK